MSFCRKVSKWSAKQGQQWSTWRGLMLGVASITAIVNPVLGVAVVKAVGVVIGTVEVIKDDSNL